MPTAACVHEAAHVVVALARGVEVLAVEVAGGRGRTTLFYPRGPVAALKLLVQVSGFLAETLRGELLRCSSLMWGRCSDVLSRNGFDGWREGSDCAVALACCRELGDRAEQAILSRVRGAEREAEAILRGRWSDVERVAAALERYCRLDGEDLARLRL
jgi:hypothetical protein